MKAVFNFEKGSQRAKMILDDLALYVPSSGGLFERIEFTDEKEAAQAFNKVLMQRYSPRQGWRIRDKKVGVAEKVPNERLVGYEPSPEEADRKKGIIKTKGRLLLKLDESLSPDDMHKLMTEHITDDVTALVLYPDRRLHFDPAVEVLADLCPAQLQTLIIDAYDQTVTRQAHVSCGDLGGVLALPKLERLYVVGSWTLPPDAGSDTLKQLSLLADPMDAEDVRHLAAGAFPKLASLDLGLSTESAVDDDVLTALPGALAHLAPKEAVRISGEADVADLIVAWAGKKTKELVLAGSVADSSAVKEVALAHKKAWKAAGRIGLPLGELDDEDAAAIAALGVELFDTDEGPHPFDPARYDHDAFLGKS